MRAFLTEAADKEAKFAKMNSGKEGWSEGLKDMNSMPPPKRNANKKYTFRDVEYSNYTL